MDGSGSIYDQADCMPYTLTGAGANAGVMTCAITPIGELWKVLYGDVYHDDPAAISGTWYISDGATKIQIGDGAVLAALTRRNLYTAAFTDAIMLSPSSILSWEVASGATAGKKITISVILKRIRGVQ